MPAPADTQTAGTPVAAVPDELPPADGTGPAVRDSEPAILSTLDVTVTPQLGDLDEIVARRQVRMLVAHDRSHFYFDGGRQSGIVADAIAQFESWLNARLKMPRTLRIHAVVVSVPRSELIAALLDGRGDVIAMPLAATAARRQQVAFADHGTKVDEVFVTREGTPALDGLETLTGREVHVREGSSPHESLLALNARLAEAGREPVRIVALDPNLDTHDALEMVDAGLIPATLAERYIATAWEPSLPGIRIEDALRLRSEVPLAWAVRPESRQLLDTVSTFQKQHRVGTLWGNLKRRQYFGSGERLRDPTAEDERRRLAEVRSLFRQYADAYSLDWLLVAAQAFQESGLDHSRRSHVGAVGIMQVMPATARDPRIGIPDVEKLDRNIEAGTKYLRFVMDRYYADDRVKRLDRALFALASYNAGPARVAKLRAEARRSGLDPDVWFGHVEVVAARRIGAETVDYVRNIYKYYLAYRLLSEQSRT